MKLDYGAAWDALMTMLRANTALLVALAGVFFLLPALCLGILVPPPQGAETIQQMIADWELYYTENWRWLMLANIVNMMGSISIYALLLHPGRFTVGQAIGKAVGFLPFYVLLSILTTLIFAFGLFWLILPGIYLMGRVTMSGPAMVAEEHRNPIAAIASSWQLTRGNGWSVAGLLILVGIPAYLVLMIVTAVFGTILILLLGTEGLGGLLRMLLAATLGAGYSTLLVLLFAAIYRQLASTSASRPD